MTPSVNGPALEIQPTAQQTRRAPRPPGLLVVDDNDAVRTFLGIAVRASGFAVWLASGCLEGLTLYQQHAAEIDLVLIDVRMPDYDGPETLAAVRAVAPTVPCCFMSGDPGEYTEADLLDYGAVAVFHKPFRVRELVAHLRSLVAPPDAVVEAGPDVIVLPDAATT